MFVFRLVSVELVAGKLDVFESCASERTLNVGSARMMKRCLVDGEDEMRLTSQWSRKWMLDFRSPHSLACVTCRLQRGTATFV